MDPDVLALGLLGFVLVIGSLVVLTTFGKKRPAPVLVGLFAAFAAYIAIILVRIGALHIPWLSSVVE